VIGARIAAIAACVFTAGCGTFGGDKVEENGPGVLRPGALSPVAAQAAVHPGSVKAEVVAALGPGNGVAFESGWEVWVYRWPGADRSARSATELVILFDRSGTVRKTRMRPGIGPGVSSRDATKHG
jgi:hypothetical protein